MFTGFQDSMVDFLWGIRFNDERSWFEENKPVYLTQVQQPMRQLGEALYAYMQRTYPELWLNLHVSRIYRDARRLHGRGPYKDHLWLSLRHENENWTSRPVFYFEIAPEGWSCSMGFYSATPAVMERFRQAVWADPKPPEQLTAALNAQSEFVLEGPEYARKKPSPTPLLEPWMSRKTFSLCCDRTYEDAAPFSEELVERLCRGFDFLVPYYRYFEQFCRDEAQFH